MSFKYLSLFLAISFAQSATQVSPNLKVGMELAKSVQLQLWQSLKACEGDAFAGADFGGDEMRKVPVRVCLPGRPAIQACTAAKRTCSSEDTLTEWQNVPRRCMQVPITPTSSQEGGESLTSLEDSLRLSLGAHYQHLEQTGYETRIQGLCVSPQLPVLHLWQLLQHPDRFLYVTIQPV